MVAGRGCRLVHSVKATSYTCIIVLANSPTGLSSKACPAQLCNSKIWLIQELIVSHVCAGAFGIGLQDSVRTTGVSTEQREVGDRVRTIWPSTTCNPTAYPVLHSSANQRSVHWSRLAGGGGLAGRRRQSGAGSVEDDDAAYHTQVDTRTAECACVRHVTSAESMAAWLGRDGARHRRAPTLADQQIQLMMNN